MLLPLAALAATAAPAWFVCDGIDRPVAWVVDRLSRGTVRVTRVAKPGGGTATRVLALGRGEPGAGQIYHGLGPAGRAGNLHLVNPGMVGPGATMPVATSVTLDGVTTQCRWLADMVLNGVTARRGVTVTQTGGVLVYRSYDFARPGRIVRPDGVQRATAPSLEIIGGRPMASGYRFVHGGYEILVRSSGPGGTLLVRRGGRTVQTEPFLGLSTGR